MDRDRAREVLRQAEQVVRSEPVYGGRPAEVVREGAVLELLDEEEIAEMLGETREERDTYVEALRRIAEPDGWPVGTVVQARGVTPGPLNRWIVAAGPMPLEHERDVLLVDEACAVALESGRVPTEKRSSLVWDKTDVLCDYYHPEAFEPV